MKFSTEQTLTDLATVVMCLFIEALWWMWGLMFLHHIYPQVPAVGYWTAIIAVLFFGNADSRTMTLRRLKRLTGETK